MPTLISEIVAEPVRQHGSLLFVSQAGASVATQSYRLSQFVQRMLARQPLNAQCTGSSQIRETAGGAPNPSALSASVTPIGPAGQHIAFDLTALRRLRDTTKLAELAPACLERELAELAADASRLATVMELQDALRTCGAVAVFDAAHLRELAALGARRISLVSLPALPPLLDTAPTTDVLLIQHEGSGDAQTLALQQAIQEAIPDLRLGRDGTGMEARIHVHAGERGIRTAAVRVIDSHAMQRAVIRLAANRPGPCADAAMEIVPMRTGLTAGSIQDAVRALRWLPAHPVFEEVFRSEASRAVEQFNRGAEAQLREALA